MDFVVSPLPTSVAERMRAAGSDDYGNALAPQVQTQPGNPCRHCLRRANAGESLVLFSYSPFELRNPYKEVGPVFVHAEGCAPYDRAAELPPAFLDRPLTLRAYDAQQTIVAVASVVDGRTEPRVRELLSDPAVAYLHARSFTHGCYLFRIDRAPLPPDEVRRDRV